jgi:two-component system cell cycle response regulator DivK
VAKTVLIIEDNEQNMYLMKYLLEARGYRTVTARDGHEGIAAARAEAPDVILLDIQLPTISGHEVARTLKADPSVSAIPVIAVTSYAMPGDREEVMAAGCTGYIEKPIDPDSFIDRMESFVSSGSVAPNGARSENGGGT